MISVNSSPPNGIQPSSVLSRRASSAPCVLLFALLSLLVFPAAVPEAAASTPTPKHRVLRAIALSSIVLSAGSVWLGVTQPGGGRGQPPPPSYQRTQTEFLATVDRVGSFLDSVPTLRRGGPFRRLSEAGTLFGAVAAHRREFERLQPIFDQFRPFLGRATVAAIHQAKEAQQAVHLLEHRLRQASAAERTALEQALQSARQVAEERALFAQRVPGLWGAYHELNFLWQSEEQTWLRTPMRVDLQRQESATHLQLAKFNAWLQQSSDLLADLRRALLLTSI